MVTYSFMFCDLWLQAVIRGNLCGLNWGYSLYKEAFCFLVFLFLFFSSWDLRGHDNLRINFYDNFAWNIPAPVGSINLYLKLTWGQTSGYKLSGEIFFPLKVLLEIEKIPCCFPLWVEFFLVHLFSESIAPFEGPGSIYESQFYCPTLWPFSLSFYPQTLLLLRMTMTSRVTNLSTCFSYLSVLWAYRGFPFHSWKEKKK